MAGVGPGITVTESPASDSGGGRKDEASRDSSRSLTPSPRLSRKMLEEIMAENTCSTEDPENYPLHSTWSFWFDRLVSIGRQLRAKRRCILLWAVRSKVKYMSLLLTFTCGGCC